MGIIRAGPKGIHNLSLAAIQDREQRTWYELRDRFDTPLAAGAVNGTAASPGPGGPRAVTDTANQLSIHNGKLVIAGPAAVPANGDPGIWWASIPRQAGLAGIVQNILPAIANGEAWFGFDNAQAGAAREGLRLNNVGEVVWHQPTGSKDEVATYAAGTLYGVGHACRSAGFYAFLKAGAGQWELVWIDDTASDATLYPCIPSLSQIMTCDEYIVPAQLWLPVPLASDGFGTVPAAIDWGGRGLNGTHNRVGLDGDFKALYNGSTAYTNIYSAGLNSRFDGDEWTVIARSKLANSSYLTGTAGALLQIRVDANNRIYIWKTTGANTYQLYYNAGGGGPVTINDTSVLTTWLTWAATGSSAANQTRFYLNGVEAAASPAAHPGAAWVGNLSATACCVGALDTTPTTPFTGWASEVVVSFGVVATPAQVLEIYNRIAAGTLDSDYLDSVFGALNYAWWKLDENYSTDGLGHAEGVAGGIGSGGDGRRWDNQSFAVVSNTTRNHPPRAAEMHTQNNAIADPNGTEANATAGWAAQGATVLASQNVNPYAGTWHFNASTVAPGVDTILSNAGVLATVAERWYSISFAIYISIVGGQSYDLDMRNSADGLTMWTFETGFNTGGPPYVVKNYTYRASGANERFRIIHAAGGAGAFNFDNFSFREISEDQLITTSEYDTEDMVAEVELTISGSTQAGLVFCVDDPAKPENFIVAYYDGRANVVVDKCVEGVYTTVFTAAVTYQAGGRIRLSKSGTSVYCWYEEAADWTLVGSGTVSDTGVIGNKHHGLFSTYEGNVLDNAVFFGRGTNGEYAHLDNFRDDRDDL